MWHGIDYPGMQEFQDLFLNNLSHRMVEPSLRLYGRCFCRIFWNTMHAKGRADSLRLRLEVGIEGRNRELESYTPQFTCLDSSRIDSRKPPSNAAKYWASARAPAHNSETSRPALLGILIPPTPRVPVRDQKKKRKRQCRPLRGFL